ncbi:hypothetical protein MCOR02_004502 [Pyricularia oryzae]|nr:hypothetical protein MCOR02_004502 [Pyricularia oryzae]
MAAAAMSTVASTALTPPSSSHGITNGSNKLSNGYHDTWDDFSGGDDENPMALKKTPTTNSNHASINSQTRSTLISQNGNSNPYSSHAPISRKISREVGLSVDSTYGSDMPGATAYRSYGGGNGAVSPSESIGEVSGGHRNGKRANADYGSSSDGSAGTDEASKWIHRDKLARIESEELQAAGIILPAASRNRSRSRSRPRVHANGSRTRSESTNGATRSRKNSNLAGGRDAYGETKAQQIEVPSWDLRLPEEVADEMESNYWTSTPVSKGASKIPVAKVSPAPIPVDYIERESPAARKRENSPADEMESIKMPRTRARSSSASTKLEPAASPAVTPGQKQTKRAATDTSPKKPAARKTLGACEGDRSERQTKNPRRLSQGFI